ncbi:MAG: hypothetical protein GY778_18055 [bacterium]|nr:hypothetical protein [bacterium]
MARNEAVEHAARRILATVDSYIGGARVRLPNPQIRKACDLQLSHSAGSVRWASLFLANYAVCDPGWDCQSVPTGIRGKYGDKLVAEELTRRHITLHNAITAFGENLGWKGNVASVRMSNDQKFAAFAAALGDAGASNREMMADYRCARFADSRREMMPLPPVGDDVLTFAKAKQLFTRLLGLPTEGHAQQFLIAAMLSVHRRRYGIEIKTHHPHASDKYDETAGDIEEIHDDRVVRAYEVTVRADWKSRLSVFRAKMDKWGLPKYVIIAGGVNADDELAEPASLIRFLNPMGRDIAVLDIHDVAIVMAAELSAAELRAVVNLGYDYLGQPRLCGRRGFQDAYRAIVDVWLDERTPDSEAS